MGGPDDKPVIEVCSGCGKLFPHVRLRLCKTCAISPEKRFALVKQYLLDNRRASITEVAEGTGLPRAEVARFQAEGRLVMSPGLGDDQPGTP